MIIYDSENKIFHLKTKNSGLLMKEKDEVKLQTVLSAVVDFKDSQYDFIHLSGACARERIRSVFL